MKWYHLVLLAVLLLNLPHCSKQGGASMQELRNQMVSMQIESRGVKEQRVLTAMRIVPRDKFVPGQLTRSAYDDNPLAIGHGQTISQPYIVALMGELCKLDGTEKVLEIGTGSGYQAAVLSVLAKEVYSIEIVEPLGKSAIKRLKDLGYNNVTVKIGDGYKGWKEHAPFDVIILTASPPKIPQALIDQLSDDNGILVAPEGDFTQELVTLVKNKGKITRSVITYVRFVPMVPGEK